ncbi:MAG: HPr family phosphocarrier protein [bacterium]
MATREVEIVNRLGLHLRAAAALVQLADSFPCHVWIHKDGQRANGKSILSVLSLGAPKGDRIMFETSGERADEALAALVKFVSNRFGEPD